MTEPWTQTPHVAVVGGGLAGLAAGSALAASGFRVTLFERRAYLGGRASSYQHPATGEVVDNCQHVLLGCCTNLIEFYRRVGVEDKIRWYDQLTFLEPGGRASVIGPSSLPAPLHTAPAFLRARCLNLTDKLSIAAAMAALAPAMPRDTGEPFLKWLHRHGQTDRAIGRFWKPVFRSTCWRGCCPKLQRQTLYGKPWTPLRHRRLQAFICGSIARLPTLSMPSCSTVQFSGCFTNRCCWTAAPRAMAVMWNWW